MRAYSTRFIAREHAGLIEAANRGLDTTGLALAALIVTYGFPHAADRPTRDWILLVLLNLLCNLLIFQQSGLYRSWRGRPFSDQLGRLMLAGLGASLITFVIWAALNLESEISPVQILVWLALGIMLICLQRAVFQIIVRHYRRRGVNTKHILIYGAGNLGQSIAEQARLSPETGYRVMAYIDDDPRLAGNIRGDIPIIGGLLSMDEWLKKNEIDEIWVALPLDAVQRVTKVLEVADTHMVSVRLFPDLNGLALLNHSVSEMLGLPIIDLNVNQMQGLNRLIKELEDKILGVILFILALPIIGAISLAIKLSSGGPILFRQRRNGWDGRPFTIYKFRTMLQHDEQNGQLTQAKKDDARFTKIGRWLRRSSLDELPQLFNVLQGKMSLVGPRPHAVEHNNFFQKRISGYMRRHRVKPGITGWAQINDLRGEILEIDDMSRRLKHDLYYIEHWSLMFDLRIIIATLLKIFSSKKAW
jgi:putative colanic acid biosynthesis UDP-glucose lipid carrier transferase